MLPFVSAYLAYQNLIKVWNFTGDYGVGINTYTMIMFCKLWIFAFAFKDGAKPKEQLTVA